MILKLYHSHVKSFDVEHEVGVHKSLRCSTLQIPATLSGVVEVKGRRGVVFERVKGEQLGTLFERHPLRIRKYSRRMAHLHASIHSTAGAVARPQRALFEEKIANSSLPAASRIAARALLRSLPQGQSLCHGDFHTGNILIDKEIATLIDWGDATLGNPLADVARSYLNLRYSWPRFATSALIHGYCRCAATLYVRAYLDIVSLDRREFREWVVVSAAARLSEEGEHVTEAAQLRSIVGGRFN